MHSSIPTGQAGGSRPISWRATTTTSIAPWCAFRKSPPTPGSRARVASSGPAGPYADRVYVNRWYLIGPFERKHGDAWLAPDPPEQAIILDAAYRGKDGRLLKWEYVDSASYPLVPAQPAEEAVYYGYTELMVDKEQDLTIWVGANDDAQLWLNDRLVWRGRKVAKALFYREVDDTGKSHGRDYNFSEGKRVVHLRQGRNKLFFKLSNGLDSLFFSLVLTK